MGIFDDWIGQRFRAGGASEVEREAVQEYHAPTYSVSFKSVLIAVLVLVAVFVVGAILIFA